jgi:hypothetical protein
MNDVLFLSGYECHTNDMETVEIQIRIDGDCWMNIHPHNLNVYDFTFWSGDMDAHPGNSAMRNPIKEFAEKGMYELSYPIWHEMWRWHVNSETKLEFLGRFGDTVDFVDLPEEIRGEAEMLFGTSGIVVCGSPGEVTNDHSSIEAFIEINAVGRTNGDMYRWSRQRKQVWTEIVLKAPDQLRQRTAW